MMYITHMLLVWQYFYLKLTIRDNGSSIWNHGTTINFGLSGIMVLLFHMVLLMIGAKIHYGTCIPYTPSVQDLRVGTYFKSKKMQIFQITGHRMVMVKRHLVVFGGFHDSFSGDNTKYFNDVGVFDTDNREWKKVEVKKF